MLFSVVAVIPIAVSVHTVVSWVFGMQTQPMWHSSIFAPYFVTGAIYSGIATIIIVTVILRKVYRLEEYLTPYHFNNMGLLLLVFTLLWFYFTFAENLTAAYGGDAYELAVFWTKATGKYTPLFWLMAVLCLVIPFILLVFKADHPGAPGGLDLNRAWDVAGTFPHHHPLLYAAPAPLRARSLYPFLGRVVIDSQACLQGLSWPSFSFRSSFRLSRSGRPIKMRSRRKP